MFTQFDYAPEVRSGIYRGFVLNLQGLTKVLLYQAAAMHNVAPSENLAAVIDSLMDLGNRAEHTNPAQLTRDLAPTLIEVLRGFSAEAFKLRRPILACQVPFMLDILLKHSINGVEATRESCEPEDESFAHRFGMHSGWLEFVPEEAVRLREFLSGLSRTLDELSRYAALVPSDHECVLCGTELDVAYVLLVGLLNSPDDALLKGLKLALPICLENAKLLAEERGFINTQARLIHLDQEVRSDELWSVFEVEDEIADKDGARRL